MSLPWYRPGRLVVGSGAGLLLPKHTGFSHLKETWKKNFYMYIYKPM